MINSDTNYRVGLVLSNNLEIADYELSVGDQKCHILFYNESTNGDKYCDLVISDKSPEDLTSLPEQQKNCHGTTLIVNNISNPIIEQQYESVFTKASLLKYKSLKINKDAIIKTINSELIKHQTKENRFDTIRLLFNKNTRYDLLRHVLDLSWLLVPFFLILLYIAVKVIANQFGYSFSFLCWFVEYSPDCKTNVLQELKLLALIYSIFNFKFYYDYILSIYDNINNDVFQFNSRLKLFHKILQFFTPLMLFSSALVIFKAIFIFKFGFRIASENSFINMSLVFDRYLPFIKDDFLIYYFLFLDICLWLITTNFMAAIKIVPHPFSSNRQLNLIKEAQKSFRTSIVWDIAILLVTALLFTYFIPNTESKLAFQLIFLQAVYLYINISTIFYDFKYK